jgi:hypothetical protein
MPHPDATDPLHVLLRMAGGESHRRRTAALAQVADVVDFDRYQPNNDAHAYLVRVGGVRLALSKAQVLPFVVGVLAARGDDVSPHLQPA